MINTFASGRCFYTDQAAALESPRHYKRTQNVSHYPSSGDSIMLSRHVHVITCYYVWLDVPFTTANIVLKFVIISKSRWTETKLL